jgi:glycosyltransferase involved in cell wall biosynthesis
MRTLVAIPVFNEQRYLRRVLERVLGHVGNVVVIDDGSTDDTPRILPEFPVDVIRHCVNRGYGQALINAFAWAVHEKYDWVISMDCDEQHEPDELPQFLEAAEQSGADIVSGSRYLLGTQADDDAPTDRRAINAAITDELNLRLGLSLTDSFCGFKAHRVAALPQLALSERGYAFPMQFWVRAVAARLNIIEVPVRRIYNDPTRTFGGPLDNPASRLAHYRAVMHSEILASAGALPQAAMAGLCEGYCRR